MNLGFVLFDYFPFGGLQRDCVKIARLCAARGHQITLFARTWEGERPPDIGIQLLGRRGLTNPSRNRHFLTDLTALRLSQHFDGVVGFNKMPGLDVYFGADPCYIAKVSRLKPRWYRWLPRFRHFASLERAVYGRGNATQILLLKATEIPLYREFYKTEPERLHVLPPGIARRSSSEQSRLEARRRIRAEHRWAEQDRILLFVGSGFRIKGLDRAIASLAAVAQTIPWPVRLVVIGQNQPGRFLKQARRLAVADRVHFLGGRHDVPDFMQAADLLIHPAYSENTGTILVEALASGLPVLTTDICGFAFHVEKARAGTVLGSPFRQEACNQALSEMLEADGAQVWRANGLAYAAREDLYSCHDRAADLIEETVRRKLAGAG
jgi:UDP-glucose:(heptosyl)LPS alpha-1,3-glucosyltransferase